MRYLKQAAFVVIAINLILLTHPVWADRLIIEPSEPIVEIGGRLTLSVSGASGNVTWQAMKGWIAGDGMQVIYFAPDEITFDAVTVLDEEGNIGTTKVTVVSRRSLSLDQANWKIYADRGIIPALRFSAFLDKLFVGTTSGLEIRKAENGELSRILTEKDGLPGNKISALAVDSNQVLWIGTTDGLASYDSQGRIKVFSTENSPLPSNSVSSLYSDNSGLWIGTTGGLAHYTEDGDWQVFTVENSGLPSNSITTLIGGDSGIWIGTSGGLAYYGKDGKWQTFTVRNSGLPDNYINALYKDSTGLWIGTGEAEYTDSVHCCPRRHAFSVKPKGKGGLARLGSDGSWTIFTKENSNLPNNQVSSIVSDDNNGLWVGTGDGLVHITSNGSWEMPDKYDSLTGWNPILSLSSDSKGGVWVGTFEDGLRHFSHDGHWLGSNFYQKGLGSNNIMDMYLGTNKSLWVATSGGGISHLEAGGTIRKFDWYDSEIPSNSVSSILEDDTGNLWIGTDIGLAVIQKDGTWKIFNPNNSGLPDFRVESIEKDGSGGIWIGTWNGLAHYKKDSTWEVFHQFGMSNTDDVTHTYIVPNVPRALCSDKKGGIWIGTDSGLAHYSQDGHWDFYTEHLLHMPLYSVDALFLDQQGTLWIGTDSGLVRHTSGGTWKVFNSDNSALPSNIIKAIDSDMRGGLWIGTWGGGIAHFSKDGTWTVINAENSELPSNNVTSLRQDNAGGLWVGTFSDGLAHLSFGSLQGLGDETYLKGERAAIIIAGGGNDSENTLWYTTQRMTNYIYKMLNKRGFLNSDIYYLSPQSWADFNGDGRDDHIVDAPRPERPLTLEDIRGAFEWAKGRGTLNQPLYIFFVDHGGSSRLQLSKFTYLESPALKKLLDDYQEKTGNDLVLTVDACHSGSLMRGLAGQGRAIITSTGQGEEAYFDRLEDQGFSRFLAKGLLKGMNFYEAFSYASERQKEMLGRISRYALAIGGSSTDLSQDPQMDDTGDGVYTQSEDGQWLKKVYVNGSVATGDITVSVEAITEAGTVQARDGITLKAKVGITQGSIQRVWATIRPPKMDIAFDTYGTPLISFPTAELYPSKTDESIWEFRWTKAVYNGDYEVTYYVQDSDGNINNSHPVNITVIGGVNCPSSAKVNLHLDERVYHPGDLFTVSLQEDISWGYDLYIGIILPDGKFVTLSQENRISEINQIQKWIGKRGCAVPYRIMQFTLPQGLPEGRYYVIAILSPEREQLLTSRKNWISDVKHFTIVNN